MAMGPLDYAILSHGALGRLNVLLKRWQGDGRVLDFIENSTPFPMDNGHRR